MARNDALMVTLIAVVVVVVVGLAMHAATTEDKDNAGLRRAMIDWEDEVARLRGQLELEGDKSYRLERELDELKEECRG